MVPDRHYLYSSKPLYNVAPWNVRTLLLDKGNLDNVKNEMKRININIMGISGAGEFGSDK